MGSQGELLRPFPPKGDGSITADQKNPAIRLYGRRFYKDEAPIEYLSEFLMVFASPKQQSGEGAYSLSIDPTQDPPVYWPENRIALKLFTFFPSSKLDTRHIAHRNAYADALKALSSGIRSREQEGDDIIRLLQSLFAGFVGVAKNRTWVTQNFLPAAASLLAREITWNHPAALAAKNAPEILDWNSSKPHFDPSTHNFFGRGGELLFLQLANLFSGNHTLELESFRSQAAYSHLRKVSLDDLRRRLERGLKQVLLGAAGKIDQLALFVESKLRDYRLGDEQRPTRLGWIPAVTSTEALLFAVELDNICRSTVGELEKVELLRILCAMQVLRSLCFQARRIDEHEGTTESFVGNYAWIASAPAAPRNSPTRQLAQRSYERTCALLFRALRSHRLFDAGATPTTKDFKNGDDNCLGLFRKFAKELGLVIPRTSTGQRFVLAPTILRFLVSALIPPGDRVRLTVFYERVFAHYGIALGSRQLATAIHWMGSDVGGADYAVATDTGWLEEALQQGGFLVELSDAVSLVRNPGARRDAA